MKLMDLEATCPRHINKSESPAISHQNIEGLLMTDFHLKLTAHLDFLAWGQKNKKDGLVKPKKKERIFVGNDIMCSWMPLHKCL